MNDSEIKKALKDCQTETILNDQADGRGTGSLRLRINRWAGGDVTAVWFSFWKTDGKRRMKTLGRYPDLSLKDARTKHAEEVRALLQAGRNPKAIVIRADRPTVTAMFQGYVDAMREDGKVSADDVERSLLKGKYAAVKHFGANTEPGAVEPADVSMFLAGMYQRGARVAADRCRAHLSAAFNWGIKSTHDYRVENRRDWGVKVNPVTAVQRDESSSTPRERTLTTDEVRAFWHGTARFAPETRQALRMLICCGQRVRETLRLEPDEIVDGVWAMPTEKTKMKVRPHWIPLPDLALTALEGFNGFTTKDTSLNQAIRRWCDLNQVERFQTRDLRRTWKTLTAEAGIDRFTRDVIQQHAKGDTASKHYDRAEYMTEKRAAMQRWNEYLVGVLESANG